MLAVVILILKILLIFILTLLGVVGLLLVLILFVPFKYKSCGLKEDDSFWIHASVTYLYPLINVKIKYPEKKIVEIKILFFTIFTKSSYVQEDNVFLTDSDAKKENIQKSEVEGEMNIDIIDKKESKCKEAKYNETKHKETKEKEFQDKGSKNKEVNNKKNLEFDQKEAQNKNTSENKENKKNIDKIAEYVKLTAENKEILLDVIGTILKAIKTILPKKCNIKIVCGTGQADSTGYICAIYYAILELLPRNINIFYEPVWTEKILKGDFEIRGKIRLINLIVAAVKIIANKKVRNLYKLIRSI